MLNIFYHFNENLCLPFSNFLKNIPQFITLWTNLFINIKFPSSVRLYIDYRTDLIKYGTMV